MSTSTSPAGIGLGALVYNYDGDVYASDEGRMLAEMGDHTFRLGNVASQQLRRHHAVRETPAAAGASPSRSARRCADLRVRALLRGGPSLSPRHHWAISSGTRQPRLSASRNMGVFKAILRRARDDKFARDLFWRWAQR